MESTVLLAEPEPLDAELLQETEAGAKAEAEKHRPGLAVFTGGPGRRALSGLEERTILGGASKPTWSATKEPTMQNAPLSPGHWELLREETTPERATIFTDAQAAIKRMASEVPGPGHTYTLQARKHIAALRRTRPDITVEMRWRPAHKGVPGNEKADEWAKLAAEKPDARGVECLGYSDRTEAGGNATPQVSCTPQAGDFRGEVG